jgi:3-deoxy-manno-octulosonate cytidylyltransferase (CMP-KDO synthetase)
MSGFRVVIPSRYASQRLPAKALREIAGRPLVVHVLERAMRSGADEVIVATDDERIGAAVREAGGRVRMTSPDHASGTDRLWEVAREEKWDDGAIVVNLQGDEPLVPPSMLDAVAAALREREDASIATFATPIRDALSLFSPSVVKAVLDREGFALYFSRAPIPWVRDAFVAGKPNEGALPEGTPFLRHLGLYAYRVRTLRALCAEDQAAIERAESLEQLRALALGMRIHVSVCDEAPPPGVDTEEDLARVRAVLET